MKRSILVVFLLLFMVPSYGQILTGEVNYSVKDARAEVINSEPEKLPLVLIENNFIDLNKNSNKANMLYGNTDLKDRTLALFSDGSYGVTFKKDPIHVFYYSNNGVLTHIDVKSSLEYPYKTYKYTFSGDLVNMSLRVSETEAFVFDLKGKLLAHWVGENCYDEYQNIIMTRKIKK